MNKEREERSCFGQNQLKRDKQEPHDMKDFIHLFCMLWRYRYFLLVATALPTFIFIGAHWTRQQHTQGVSYFDVSGWKISPQDFQDIVLEPMAEKESLGTLEEQIKRQFSLVHRAPLSLVFESPDCTMQVEAIDSREREVINLATRFFLHRESDKGRITVLKVAVMARQTPQVQETMTAVRRLIQVDLTTQVAFQFLDTLFQKQQREILEEQMKERTLAEELETCKQGLEVLVQHNDLESGTTSERHREIANLPMFSLEAQIVISKLKKVSLSQKLRSSREAIERYVQVQENLKRIKDPLASFLTARHTQNIQWMCPVDYKEHNNLEMKQVFTYLDSFIKDCTPHVMQTSVNSGKVSGLEILGFGFMSFCFSVFLIAAYRTLRAAEMLHKD